MGNKSLFIGEDFKSQKLAQILTSRGFKAEDLVKTGLRNVSIILDGQFANEKLAQILTEHGFQAGQLVENG